MLLRLLLPLTVLIICGCAKQARAISLHEKYGWKAKSFFTQEQTIQLCNLIDQDNFDGFQKCINDGFNIHEKGVAGMTLLLWAYTVEDQRFFELLIKNNADPNVYVESDFNSEDLINKGESVTHVVSKGSRKSFYALFDTKGDVNLPSREEMYFQQTPIFFVLRSKANDIHERVEYLIKQKADINVVAGGTPLLLTTMGPRGLKITLLLLNHGANCLTPHPDNGFRLIHSLVKNEKDFLPQKQDYDKVIAFLMSKGESVEAAKEDLRNWKKQK